MQSRKRRGYTIDIITPHILGDIKFHVKRYANGHLAYNMERHGKMAYWHFIPITQKQLKQLISNSARMTEAQMRGLGILGTLKEVFG